MSGIETAIIAGLTKAGAAIKSAAVAATSSVGGAAAAGGTILSTVGAIQAGKSQQAMANYQAKLADKRAKEEKALSIKTSRETRRRGRIAASRARAVGAASGGGVDWDLMEDLDEETEIRAMNAIWEGQSRYDDLQAQAGEARARGKAAKKAGYLKAAGTLLGGADNLMYKYG